LTTSASEKKEFVPEGHVKTVSLLSQVIQSNIVPKAVLLKLQTETENKAQKQRRKYPRVWPDDLTHIKATDL